MSDCSGRGKQGDADQRVLNRKVQTCWAGYVGFAYGVDEGSESSVRIEIVNLFGNFVDSGVDGLTCQAYFSGENLDRFGFAYRVDETASDFGVDVVEFEFLECRTEVVKSDLDYGSLGSEVEEPEPE